MRILAFGGAAVYLVFAGACFHLVGRDKAPCLALGEGLFTLLGGLALGWAALKARRSALVTLMGTLPLVGWFAATPYNSGPPFLVASLIAPAIALAALLSRRAA